MPAPDIETLAARVSGHDESLRAISDSLVDLTKDVRGLSRRMDRIEGRMGGLEGRMGGVEGRMGGVEGRMGGLEVRVDGIQTTVDQHTGMLSEILHILRAPDGSRRAGGEGDPPSPGGDR